MYEVRTITLNADEVKQAAQRPGERVKLWMRYNGYERLLYMPFHHLLKLYEVVKNESGLIDVLIQFDLLKFSYASQFTFRLARGN